MDDNWEPLSGCNDDMPRLDLRPLHQTASRKGGRPTRHWRVKPALLQDG